MAQAGGRGFAVHWASVREGRGHVAVKRFLAPPGHARLPPWSPAVLLVHGGPGLPSRYLEPLAQRLCAFRGRTVYAYDQPGCGLSAAAGTFGSMAQGARDLRDVLAFLGAELGEREVHLVGHGLGGALVMEALLREGIYLDAAGSEDRCPRRSPCAWSPRRAARPWRRRRRGASSRGWPRRGAPRGLPGLLLVQARLRAEAAAGGAGGRLSVCLGPGERRRPQRRPARLGAAGPSGLAARGPRRAGGLGDPRGGGRPALRRRRPWRAAAEPAGQRGDFVTAACVRAWRAAGAGGAGARFQEATVHGCGHHAHLEDPEAFAAALRLWLLAPGAARSERLPQAHSKDDMAAAAARREATGELQVLSKSEAYRHLSGWASELSWKAVRTPSPPPARRHRHHGQRLSYLDGRAPSRMVRQLATWARALRPGAPDGGSASSSAAAPAAPGAGSAEAVREALRCCAAPVAASNMEPTQHGGGAPPPAASRRRSSCASRAAPRRAPRPFRWWAWRWRPGRQRASRRPSCTASRASSPRCRRRAPS
ncbi:unnamed protein product [Prorocentrum cordatum]|uniref:AB hydrolase-1 domain-containing protein n=1 Tax=Prorocentrum cordatum TaxID=2364126 RepID=A0ABN9U3J6_9DINO|nr:unnamed protein product [Polarella glacialis]